MHKALSLTIYSVSYIPQLSVHIINHQTLGSVHHVDFRLIKMSRSLQRSRWTGDRFSGALGCSLDGHDVAAAHLFVMSGSAVMSGCQLAVWTASLRAGRPWRNDAQSPRPLRLIYQAILFIQAADLLGQSWANEVDPGIESRSGRRWN